MLRFSFLVIFELCWSIGVFAGTLEERLIQTIKQGNLTQAYKTVENGPYVDYLDPDTGDAPLHLAIKSDRADLVELLLKNGALLHQKNRAGYSALELNSNPQIQDLLKNEAELRKADNPDFIRAPLPPESGKLIIETLHAKILKIQVFVRKNDQKIQRLFLVGEEHFLDNEWESKLGEKLLKHSEVNGKENLDFTLQLIHAPGMLVGIPILITAAAPAALLGYDWATQLVKTFLNFYPSPLSKIGDLEKKRAIDPVEDLEYYHMPTLKEYASMACSSGLLVGTAMSAYYCYQGEYVAAAKALGTGIASGLYEYRNSVKSYLGFSKPSPNALVETRDFDMASRIIEILNRNHNSVNDMAAFVGRGHTTGISGYLLINGFKELPLGLLKAEYEKTTKKAYPPKERFLPEVRTARHILDQPAIH